MPPAAMYSSRYVSSLGMHGASCSLPPFAWRRHPSARPLAEVIPHVHIEHRADAGEGINHHADKRPVAQAGKRAGINRRDKRPRFLAVEHRRFAFLLRIFRAAHGVRRVHVKHMADHEPVKTASAAPPGVALRWAWK